MKGGERRWEWGCFFCFFSGRVDGSVGLDVFEKTSLGGRGGEGGGTGGVVELSRFGGAPRASGNRLNCYLSLTVSLSPKCTDGPSVVRHK